MDFNLAEERQMLKDTAERFIREQYGIETRHEAAARETGYSPEMWREFAELGLVGALLPPEVEGFGGTGEDIALVFEALGRGVVVEPFVATVLAIGPLIEAGDAETLGQVMAGETVATLAHGEPDSRYSLTQVSTRAAQGADGWRLTGAKSVVPNGDSADLLVVSARSAGAADAEEGIGIFRVAPAGPGVSRRGFTAIDGGRVAEITLDDAPAAPLGDPGAGSAALERAIGRGIVAVCAEALGAMEVVKDMTVEYLKTRVQFGKPIGVNQVLQHRVVDMLIEIEQARSCVMLAASTLEADRATRERNLSAAKHLIGRVGRLVAEEVIQLHGGVAMTWESAVPHFAKRIVMIDHLFGDTDYHLDRFIRFSKEAN